MPSNRFQTAIVALESQVKLHHGFDYIRSGTASLGLIEIRSSNYLAVIIRISRVSALRLLLQLQLALYLQTKLPSTNLSQIEKVAAVLQTAA